MLNLPTSSKDMHIRLCIQCLKVSTFYEMAQISAVSSLTFVLDSSMALFNLVLVCVRRVEALPGLTTEPSSLPRRRSKEVPQPPLVS